MRTFESIQFALVCAAVLLPALLGFRLARGRIAVLLMAGMTVQLVAEGYRWQLLPLEIATIGLAVGDVLWPERRMRGLRRVRRAVLGLIGLGLVGLLPIALPVPELPLPVGGFDIGTQTFVLVDPERSEQYGLPDVVESDAPAPDTGEVVEEDQGDPRRLVVQAWYPADLDGALTAEPALWNPDVDVIGPVLARRLNLPSFFFSHTRTVRSHAVTGAPPLSGRMPVILYSHGWTGFRSIALDQIEALASSGFLVIAADHTYGSIATRFPDDGSVVEFDPRALPEIEDVDEEAYADASEQLVETFAGDLTAILDGLEAGEAGPFGPFAPSADVSDVGIFGHSTGGGAAIVVCLTDDRCRAVAGLDPWVEPIPDSIVAEELLAPSLLLRSDEWVDTPNDLILRGVAERSPAVSYFGAIAGSEHNDFVLTSSFAPVGGRLGLKGPISSDVVVPLVNERLVAFFRRFLLGMGGALLDDPPPPELDLEVIG